MKAFGSFRLDVENHCLWRGTDRAPLTPKAFDVLRYLVEHAGGLVTVDELLEALWPGTYVNPEGLRKYILEIRKVLGDPAGKPVFIETLPKRGYRFIATVSEAAHRAAAENAATVSGAIVGRQAGLRELDECLRKAVSGQRQVVFVTGEAGIGKTTLVDAFQEMARGEPNLCVARGQCIEGFGGIEAYYPMLEALGSLLQEIGDQSMVQTFAERAPTWLIQFPGLVTPALKDSIERAIVGSTKERMVRELCEIVEAFTARTTLIVILEDLHWVDHSTLDLISALARRRDPSKLMLIGTYRPVDVVLSQSPLKFLKQDLLVRRLCREIAMECLEEADVTDYLATMFTRDSIPPGFAGVVHQSSGGNPLFMVAIVQEMRNQGVIAEEQGRMVLTAPMEAVCPGIPETLQQMLEMQLEQLSAEERQILQAASIAGERFSVWSVAAVLEAAVAATDEGCNQIARRQGFIRPVGTHPAVDGTPSAFYEFRHSLYRQAFSRSLSGLQRAQLHLRLAERLIALYDAGRHELATELALHLEQARDYQRATRFLMLVAENARSRFSHRYSIGILRRALELAAFAGDFSEPEVRIEILQRIGEAHYALGEMSNSASSLQAAADLAAEAGLKAAHVRATAGLAIPLWYLDPAKGEAACGQALAMSEELADPLLAAKARLSGASCRLIYDRWREEDAECCARSEETIRRVGGDDVLPDVFHVYVKVIQGEYAGALRDAELLIAKSRNPTIHVQASGAKGFIQLIAGRFGELQRTIQTEREAAAKNEADPWIWIFGESWLRVVCWDFDGVRRLSSTAMRSDADYHGVWTRTVGRVNAGYYEMVHGNFSTALEYFRVVRNYDETPKFFLHWHWRMHAELGAAEAYLAAGKTDDAWREAEVFLSSALSIPDPNMRVLAWELKARVHIHKRDLKGARECLRNAFAILERFELPLVLWQVHRTAWDLCCEERDPAGGEEHRIRAREQVQKLADSMAPGEPLRATLLGAPPVQRLFGKATTVR